MEQAAKARVFLSYAHRDASALAQRLHDDLRAIGHAVWMDRSELRAGLAWSEAIADGVRGAQVLVALMSPSSVRRASLVSPADDSVCLDEISYALDGRKLPVVPVMALSCEPPFRIHRLQYLDFRSWERAPQAYPGLLEALSEAIALAVTTGTCPLRPHDDLPPPWDFEPLWAAARRDFVGRQWLFDAIDAWRRDRRPSLLITGRPGVGKSALVAELVHRNPGGLVLACHACQADTPATLDPAQFVRGMVGQLGLHLAGYAQLLEPSALRAWLLPAELERDPASAFEALILAPLASLKAPDDGPRCLLIDALDEALLHPGSLTIVDLLASRLPRLPVWLRVLATARPELAVLNRLGALARHTLQAEDPLNLQDLQQYIRWRLGRAGKEPAHDPPDDGLAQAEADLLRLAEGNFLVAVSALDAVAAGHLKLDELAALTPGLASLYSQFFERLHGRAAMAYAPSRRVLEAIMAAPAPPSRASLAAALGWADDRLVPILGQLASFIAVRQGCYAVFHKSLADWLTGWDAPTDQPKAGLFHASLHRGHALWADHWLPQCGATPLPAGLLQALPGHLCGAGRWDALCKLLLDGGFVAAKLAGPHTRAADLLHDLAQALRQLPAGQAERALLVDLRDALERQGQNLGRADLQAFDQLLLQTEIDGHPGLRERLLAGRRAQRLDAGSRWRLGWTTWRPDPALRRTWRLGTGYVHSLSLSADGRLAACGDDAGLIWVVDLEGGEVLRQIAGHAGKVRHCALSGDGRRVASWAPAEPAISIWDVASGERCLSLPAQGLGPQSLRLSSDGTCLLSANHGPGAPCLSLWATDAAGPRRDFDAPGLGQAWDCALASTAGRVLSAHVDGLLCLWDLPSGALVDRITVPKVDGYWSACDIATDGRMALAGAQGRLVIWEIAAGRLRRAPPAAWGTGDVFGLSADARRVISGAGDGQLMTWDLDPAHPPRLLQGHDRNELWSAAISADGRRALSASKGGHTVEWDLERARGPHPAAGHGEWIDHMAISADGRWVASMGDRRLRVWQGPGRLVHDIAVRADASGELRFDPSGAWLQFQHDGRLRQWRIDDGHARYARAGPAPSVVPPDADAAFWRRLGLTAASGPEQLGRWAEIDASGRLGFAQDDHRCWVWPLASAQALAELSHPGAWIRHCRLLASGQLLLVCDDGSVMCRDGVTGQTLAQLCLGEINCAGSSADGRWVALGNGAGEVFVLDLGEAQRIEKPVLVSGPLMGSISATSGFKSR